MKLHKKLIFTSFILFLFASLSFAGDKKITGLEIMKKVYNRPKPKDMQVDLTMILINSDGEKRIRKIKQFMRDFGYVEKKIMFFISPADVRNTSFMNWSYDKAGKSDDQWIYLPALKRIKRISSESKSDYFMGSDFTYDDLGDRKPSEDKHKLIGEKVINGEDCYIVESIPKDKDYMYSKTISYIIKNKWIGVQKKFYDEDGDFLKVLKVKGSKKIKGYWILTEIEMDNIQNDHKTIMKFDNIKLETGIPANKFTERMMKRGIR